MRPRLILGLFLAFLLSNFNLKAQEVVARLSADTTKMLIGQPLRIDLQLSQARSVDVSWPIIIDSMGSFEILEMLPVDTLPVDDPQLLLRSQSFVVSAYDSGVFTIPEITFRYKLPGQDKLQEVLTDPLSIQVFTVPVDTTADIRDIRPIEAAPFDPRWIFWIILGYHALLLITALVIWWIRRRKMEQPVPQTGPVVLTPPHLTALEALSALEEEKVWQQGHIKLYFTRLTDILRVYMDKRWMVGALELTSDEILGHGFLATVNPGNREELERILRLADLVKFARMQALGTECEWVMQLARKFVKETALLEHHPEPEMHKLNELD
ncbi:MAG: hypothetical protein JNL88_02290 [Bacteroidia bacterium]|nr:hypothetical protein [Bacteroidia bacterium]